MAALYLRAFGGGHTVYKLGTYSRLPHLVQFMFFQKRFIIEIPYSDFSVLSNAATPQRSQTSRFNGAKRDTNNTLVVSGNIGNKLRRLQQDIPHINGVFTTNADYSTAVTVYNSTAIPI